MREYRISILGPQGSGKGTQGFKLSSFLNIPVISIGQLLRDEVENNGKYKEEIKSVIDKGKLMPEDILFELLKVRLSESDVQNGYIIDGFPRNMDQYRILAGYKPFTHVVFINISDEEALKRINGRRVSSCGKIYHMVYNPPKHNETCDECGEKLSIRHDDTPEAIKTRLEIYHTYTEPVIEKYKKDGILYEVNGEQPIDDVFEDIKKIFDN